VPLVAAACVNQTACSVPVSVAYFGGVDPCYGASPPPPRPLQRLPLLSGQRVFVHINNTNPALLPHSAQRQALTDAGWRIPAVGEEFIL
jgi:hypothetical protein